MTHPLPTVVDEARWDGPWKHCPYYANTEQRQVAPAAGGGIVVRCKRCGTTWWLDEEPEPDHRCAAPLREWIPIAEQMPPAARTVLCWRWDEEHGDGVVWLHVFGVELGTFDTPPTHWLLIPDGPDAKGAIRKAT